MDLLLVALLALAISMVVIPIMMRLAPRFGLVDRPSARKVHENIMARVGGWGIVLGAIVPVMIWLPLDALVQSYLVGSLVILAFGTWDDSHEIGHYPKFIGQIFAVSMVIWYGDLYVHILPLMGLEELPDYVAKPFTLLAMVGVINAINHSDGLDGLAGGESLLSIIVITLLAYFSEGTVAVVIGLATIGGILGFLRYNTYPARLFMGDSGSQFIGFTLAVLVVQLTQNVNPALSPALPALLLGLPVIDIVTVLIQRIYQGMNWFKATKNHIHHRMLDLGFSHYETVVIIYTIHAVFVISAIFSKYASDVLILSVYFAYAFVVFFVLLRLKSIHWTAATRHHVGLGGVLNGLRNNPATRVVARTAISTIIPLYLIAGSVLIDDVPMDFGLLSLLLAGTALLSMLLVFRGARLVERLTVYVSATFVVFLTTQTPIAGLDPFMRLDLVIYVCLMLGIVVLVRFSAEHEFRTTTMDYLVVFVLITLAIMSEGPYDLGQFSGPVIKIIIILYGCELLLNKKMRKWDYINLGSLAALSILTVRGLLL